LVLPSLLQGSQRRTGRPASSVTASSHCSRTTGCTSSRSRVPCATTALQ
jgi:hypothetical protein